MKFKDYNSSYITPQMTLIKKFNALLKYMEDYVPVPMLFRYKHKVKFINSQTEVISPEIELLSFSETPINTIDDLLKGNFSKLGMLIAKVEVVGELMNTLNEFLLKYDNYYNKNIVREFKTSFDTEGHSVVAIESLDYDRIYSDVVIEVM